MAGKYVINGAKIKCSLCTKPEGTLMVTSNVVGVQDQFWATEADKGKPNLLFQGNCTKFSNNPPPCMGVIAPIQWQNTALGMKVNGNAPLLESSTIMCATGGVPITIADTTQQSVPTNLQAMAESGAPVPAPEETADPEIIEAYWVDKDMNKETTLDYNEKARIRIKTENAQGKKIKVKVYESDFGPMNDDFIWEHEWTLQNSDAILSFNITPNMFIKGEEDLVHFYFTLQIEDLDEEEFSNDDADYLKVHLVRYVPRVLEALGWNKGAELQEEWFSRQPSNNPDVNDPNLSIITMDWVLGFTSAQTLHTSMIAQKIWANSAGKRALLSEIKRMASDGEITIPTTDEASTNFGVFDTSLITYKNRRVPKFDKYHYQERAFAPGTFSSLDDLTAALANFVFRMSSGGTITKTKDNYSIQINRVATYVRDSFDFIDPGWASQNLGYWNIEENKVVKLAIGSGYRLIENSSYQNYRDEFQMGGDFRLYSDIHFTNTNDTFEVPLTTF
ncbi:DUF6402 family protein [Aquimarina sp. RZ0]|uniref:DUF6402 family protein n=1 Tax=Aquimarina sp. RZ0 TaxID=2607730 RepID=UPI0011F15E67|nr:DUF6402 family protein [Aquimarina sp. RZ0]KAA1242358.1 DUF4280 domain-containing protein [Aquimarina sp. RZ0]